MIHTHTQKKESILNDINILIMMENAFEFIVHREGQLIGLCAQCGKIISN